MRKRCLFALVVIMLGICSVLGYVSIQKGSVGNGETDSYTPVQAESVNRDTSVWDGTASSNEKDIYYKDNAYHIYTAQGLAYFEDQVNGGQRSINAVLETDIDLNKTEWTPIGNTDMTSYSGSFDGNGHNIYNLRISSNSDYVGFIGKASGNISNINLIDVYIDSQYSNAYVGSLVGYYSSSAIGNTISNIYVTGEVKAVSTVGGVVGYSNQSINCVKSSVNITSNSQNYIGVGGIVGVICGTDTTASDLAYDRQITVENVGYVGGIAGQVDGNVSFSSVYYANTVADSTSENEKIGRILVTGSSEGSRIGGLIGYVSSVAKIEKSYNAGIFEFNNYSGYAGGIVGFLTNNSSNDFTYVYQIGKVSDDAPEVSYVSTSIGHLYHLNSLAANWTNKATFVSDKSEGYVETTYSGFVFGHSSSKTDSVWRMNNSINGKLPFLEKLEGLAAASSDLSLSASSELLGNGSYEDPYLIATAGDLAYFTLNYTGGYYSLVNDIDISGRAWIPVGIQKGAFTGVFDGNNHTIKGLTSSLHQQFDYFGLFGRIKGAVIKNLIVKDTIYLSSSSNSGAIVAFSESDSYLINCLSDEKAIGTGNDIKRIWGGNNGNATEDENKNVFDEGLNVNGYDVLLNADGGEILQFKSSDGKETEIAFQGEYRLIAQEGSETSKFFGVSTKDKCYQSALPSGEYLTTGENYLVKEGNKFVGCTFDQSTLILTANWEEQDDVKVTLYKNEYEFTNRFATKQLSIEKTFAYGSILQQEFPEIFSITREGFELVGIFGVYNSANKEFTEQITKDLHLTRLNKDINLYAKWKGTERAAYTLTINFQKENIQNGGCLEFSSAIKSVSLIGKNRGEVDKNKTFSGIAESNDETYSVTFAFNTSYSDLTTNELALSIEMNEGYNLSVANWKDLLIQNVGLDSEYNLITTPQISESVGAANLADKYNISFINLSSNLTIPQIKVSRNSFEQTLNVSPDDIVAFAPNVEVKAEKGGVAVACEGVVNEYSKVSGYFGFDFSHKRFLSSSKVSNGDYGIFTVNDSSEREYYVTYNTSSGESVNYKYVKEGDTYFLYKLSQTGIAEDVILKYTPTVNKFYYFYNANFVVIVTTQKEETKITNATELSEPHRREILDGDDIPTSKLAFVFNGLKGDINTNKKLDAVSKQINIVLEYSFVEIVNDEVTEIQTETPTLNGEKRIYEVADEAEQKSISFSVVNSRLYRFNIDERGTIFVYDGGTLNSDINIILKKSDDSYCSVNGKYNSNSGEITLTYNNSLVAGYYSLMIVCKKIEYTISVNNAQLENGEIVEFTQVSDTFDNATAYNGSDKSNTFNYNDTVTVMSKLKDNSYFFRGWYLKTCKYYLEYVIGNDPTNKNPSYTNSFKQIYETYLRNKSGEETTQLEIFAVFEKKSIGLILSQSCFVMSDENSRSDSASRISGLSFSDKDSTQYGIKISKAGYISNGYYIAGCVLYDGQDYTVSIDGSYLYEYGVINTTFAFEDYISSRLKNDESKELKRVFTIFPVVVCREVLLNVCSGTGVVTGFGDKKESGYVYYVNGTSEVDQTNVVYDESSKYGENFDLSSYKEEFKYRRGYKNSSFAKWMYKIEGDSTEYSLFGDEIDFGSVGFFDSKDTISIAVTCYLKWEFEDYLITLDVNEGTVSGQTNILIHYDDKVITSLIYVDASGRSTHEFQRDGYTFTGLSLEGDKVFDGALNLVDENKSKWLFSKDNTYKLTENITLKAMWEAASFTIKIFANSANSYYVDGTMKTVESFSKDNYIYDSTFENLFASLSLNDTNNLPQREGFVFDGLYMSNGEKISQDMIFNKNLNGFDFNPSDTNEGNLNLYFGWIVDSTKYNFSTTEGFEKKKIAKYKGVEIEFTIEDFLYNNEGVALFTTDKFVVTFENSAFSIDMNEGMNVATSWEFSSGNTSVGQDGIFHVREVGQYNVLLQVVVSDNAAYLNLGDVARLSLEFQVSVEKAAFGVVENDNALKLASMKRIIEKLISSADFLTLNACETFESFIEEYKKIDTSASSATADDVYQYVMIKYYQQLTNSDYLTYRTWKYENFVGYRDENSQLVTDTLESIKYLSFYIFNDVENISDNANCYLNVFDYKGDDYKDYTVAKSIVSEEIGFDCVKIVKTWGGIVPGRSYDLRLYVFDKGTYINNYQIDFDENGYYVNVGRIYVLPQVINISNTGVASTYYKATGKVEIEWYKNLENKITQYGIDYYAVPEISERIFVDANLVTSNIGDADVDTVFSIFDNENILYFEDVHILINENDEYNGYTSYFKVLPKEQEEFTILNVEGVYEITVSTKYLTLVNGSMQYIDLPDDCPNSLLRITEVEYTTGSDDLIVTNNDGLVLGAFVDSNGQQVFEIVENNTNSVKIFTSGAVKTFTVLTTNLSLGANLKFYKWMQSYIYSVDGTMEKNDNYVVNVAENNWGEAIDGPSQIELYGVYTDLVRVNYQSNFPDSYTQSSYKSSPAKLGSTTLESFYKPRELGFELLSMTYKNVLGVEVDYTNLFKNGVFVGISSDAPFAEITLMIKWKVEEILYSQVFETKTAGVGTVSDLDSDAVVNLLNKNENLFLYTYKWSFGGEVVSESRTITFENGGTTAASGVYTLEVVAYPFESFAEVVTEPATISLTFEMIFMPQRISEVVFDGETEIEYNAVDHIQTWSVKIKYYEYNARLNEYNEQAIGSELGYTDEGSFHFVVKKDGVQTTEMVDAGHYTISAIINEDFYEIDDSIQIEFAIDITPATLDLADYEFEFSKNFNSLDTELIKKVSTGLEDIEFNFDRQEGQDVGNYDLYLGNILPDKCSNYIFMMGENVVYNAGVHTNPKIAVGKFEIKTSGTLKLYYQTSELLPQNIEMDYSADGYVLKLTNDFALEIWTNGRAVKTLYLKLFDVQNDEDVVDSTSLSYLNAQVSEIVPKFYSTTVLEKAVNSSTYSYYFENGDGILKYYSNIVFETGYSFTIGTIKISVDDLDVDKVYDASEYIYFDIAGNVISDPEAEDVYIRGVYADKHVGSNIRVDLSVLSNIGEELSNYSLSAQSKLATISKKNATVQINFTKEDYTYGQVTKSNADKLIESIKIFDGEVDITSWLESGYYTFGYSLPESAKYNASGYLYAGIYSLDIGANFVDFNAEVSNAQLEIMTLEINHNLTDGMFRQIVTNATVGPYKESYTVSQTGDVIELSYYVKDKIEGDALSIGKYELVLRTNIFEYNSVKILLNQNNTALHILSEDELIYLTITDETVLNKTYNGGEYALAVDLANLKIVISNGEEQFESEFTLVQKDGGSVDTSRISKIEIFYSTNVSTFKNVGSYLLNLTTESQIYPNIIFREEYAFVVDRAQIDASQFKIAKIYDGELTCEIEEFDEKVLEDNVTVVAKFENADAGTDKNVSLYLQGEDSNNYALSTESVKGNIEKAMANVVLSKTKYTYGEFSKTDKIAFTVMVGESLVSTYQYSVSLSVLEAVYSESVWEYLLVGTYGVKMTGSSSNYTLNFDSDTEITVEKYSLSVVFAKSGLVVEEYASENTKNNYFEIEYATPIYENITLSVGRQSGSEIGYYKAVSATSQNSNYLVESVSDTGDGVYRIVKSSQVIYLLMNDEEGNITDTTTIEYDGNNYNFVNVDKKDGKYFLVFASDSNSFSRQLYTYTYSTAERVFVPVEVTIENLYATFNFRQNEVKNVGLYTYYCSSASSTNFEISFAYSGTDNCFNIEKKNLYFKEAVLSKVFDNELARFDFADAREVVNGVVDGDSVGIHYEFLEDGVLARFVKGQKVYDVSANLVGENDVIENYQLNLKTEEDVSVSGMIDFATIKITISSRIVTYGTEVTIPTIYETDFELSGYDTDKISIVLEILNKENHLSTSGFLNAGEYTIVCNYSFEDFKPVFMVNGMLKETYEQTATVTVNKKQLLISAVSGDMSAIFTKTYDGTTDCEIVKDGQNLLNIEGVITGDIAQLSKATYSTKNIGTSIKVDFEVSGDDAENYMINSWAYGVINAIPVQIIFDYNVEDVAGIYTRPVGQAVISTLAFPLLSPSFLTSNSYYDETSSASNFPIRLDGRTGFNFLNWNMVFENVEEGTNKYNYLSDVVARFGNNWSYENKRFVVEVDNYSKTVSLLNALIIDDTNNYVGYYFKGNDSLKVTFVANWDTMKYNLSITIVDENGNEVEYGQIVVNNDTVVTDKLVNKQFEYASTIDIVATAFEHCSFDAFYNAQNGRVITSDDEFAITLGSDGTYNLQIKSISRDLILQARFVAQNVSVVFDLTNFGDASVSNSNFRQSGRVFTWNAKYFDLTTVSLADIGLSRTGYEVSSISFGATTVDADDFATTMLSAFVQTLEDERISLIPSFNPVGVVVTLDYGYDNIKSNIVVSYDQSYETSVEWVETPTRDGYEFVGWVDSNNERVTGQTVVSTQQEHTLTAQWQIANFTLAITAENVELFVNDVKVDSINESITYQQTFSFVVVACEGYSLAPASEWSSEFDVEIRTDGSAIVSITMPGHDVNYAVSAIANANRISFSGENIATITVYDTTNGETEIEVNEMSALVETGKVIKIVVTATSGYEMSDRFECSIDGLSFENSVENGVLTLIVSGIKEAVSFNFFTDESFNEIIMQFDDTNRIQFVIANDREYTNLDNLSFLVLTNSQLEVYVGYKEGYIYNDYQTQQGFDVDYELTTYNNIECYKIVISNVENGTILIESALKKYTLSLQVVSFNAEGEIVDESQNVVVIRVNGQEVQSCTKDYLTVVEIAHKSSSDIYSFAGWSKNGTDIFDERTSLRYTIESNETIYAIYSAVKMNISLKTTDFIQLYTEYGDQSRIENKYNELLDIGEKYYLDNELLNEVNSVELYYGSSKTIFYTAPTGYIFAGFGAYDASGNFQILGGIDERFDKPAFTILTTDEYFDVENTNVTVYAVVISKSLTVNVSSNIDIDGVFEENTNVGSIRLVDSEENEVNQYGYVDGTRVHYASGSFKDSALISNKKFVVVAYTTDVVYLKVEIERDGYKFGGVILNNEDVVIEKFNEDGNCVIYKLSNLVGGENVDVKVLFKPLLNKISLDFVYGEYVVDAGTFDYLATGNNSIKVFSSGTGYSSIEISAYTDSKFKVSAYISIGYIFDKNSVGVIDLNNIVVADSINYQALSITDTGCRGVVSFDVEGFLGENEIHIFVKPHTMTVNFIEDKEVLVSIKNVEYDSYINLSEENSENISVFGNGIGYKDGKLNLVFARTSFNYEGFFSYQNGAGVRYIDSLGQTNNIWRETGYFYDALTSKYKIAENATINEETGEVVVSLYIYWSYLKTRITFDFTCSLSSIITAQDMLTGIDYTNSWFYETAPNYIEVAYNTAVKITAPEIDGYKFFQFIISQKNIGGTWLTDVVTYSNSIPWETNELDNIVEVRVQVIYFAKIEVAINGGNGSFKVEQEYGDAQEKALIEQNYVNTQKNFNLIALPDVGYEFVRWYNIETNKSSWGADGIWKDTSALIKTNYILTLKGSTITLDFTDQRSQNYDTTYGQIVFADIEGLDGLRREIIGRYEDGNFVIEKNSVETKVGDKITLQVAIDYGFGVEWNREDIILKNHSAGYYKFVIEIAGDMIEEKNIKVLPTFKNTILSIFVSRDFVEEQKGHNAVDLDNTNIAGIATYKGSRTDTISAPVGLDVEIGLSENERYKIESIVLLNFDNKFDMMTEYSDGKLVISSEFVSENGVIGVIQLFVKYKRVLWEDKLVESQLVGNGEKQPYQINSVEDLILMMQNVNNGTKNENNLYYAEASYILNVDLKLGEEFWTPIGTLANAFNGTFNFNGHTISAIYNPYICETINYNGLFGVLGKNAKIIENKTDVWYWYVAGGVTVVLIITIAVLVFVSHKRKKIRRKLASK